MTFSKHEGDLHDGDVDDDLRADEADSATTKNSKQIKRFEMIFLLNQKFRAERLRHEARREKFTVRTLAYPPDDPPRPSRPKAGLVLPMIMMMLMILVIIMMVMMMLVIMMTTICIRVTKSLCSHSTQETTVVKDSCGELRGEMITGDY